MNSTKEVGIEIEYVSTFKDIMQVYEEIAATRMQRIRSSVLQTRDFVFEVNNIYQQVRHSYKKQVEAIMKAKKIKDPSKISFMFAHKAKTLLVLLSANTRFYGEFVKKTYDLFAKHCKEQNADVAILGRLGLQFFQEEFKREPDAYFDLPDTQVDEETLKKIVSYITQYEQIIIFYARFVNVVSQEPIATSISGEKLPWEEAGQEVRYFFEPSLENVLAFFEKEIFASIFEQTIYESDLAKFASRMVSLDTATENAKKRLKLVLSEKNRIKHSLMNKKQSENISSIMMFTKR